MSRRSTIVLRLAFWAAATIALVLALLPHPPQLPGEPNDKIQHVAAFLVLGALGAIAYARTSALYLVSGLSLFGATIEILQLIPVLHRDSDPLDWLADTAAAALIVTVLRWLKKRAAGTRR